MTGRGGRAVYAAVQRAGIAVALLAFCAALLSFALPLAKAWSHAFAGGAAASYGALQLLRITGYTFAEATASTLLSLAVGIPAAFLVARRSFPGRRLLASCAAIPLCVPPLIIALGFISTFGMAGQVNRLLALLTGGKKLNLLYSFKGLVMAQGFYNFPIVMASVADAWSQLDTDQADSARLLGASEARCFLGITFFQLLPAVISGAITVFIYCFFSFMFVLLFGVTGGTTLEVAIYHAGRSRMDFRLAALLALLESASALAALLLLAKAENAARRLKGLSFRGAHASVRPLGKKDLPLVLGFFTVIGICFLLPLLSIVSGSFTARTGGQKAFSLAAWVQVLSMGGFHRAFRNTLLTAAGTAVMCSVASLVPALLLRLPRFSGSALLRTLPLLPLAVSSVLMGLGMTMLVRRGSPLQLVLAQSALYWPFAFRQVHACLAKIPDAVLDAAAVLSPCRTDGLFRVVLPYCRRGLISGAGFCFAMSCSDATLPLVLSIYKFDTLSLFTYRLAGSYRFTQASVAGTVLGLTCALAFSLANRAKEEHGLS